MHFHTGEMAVRKDRVGPFERLEENGTSFSNTLVYDEQDLGWEVGRLKRIFK
jgi:hypothetical protein